MAIVQNIVSEQGDVLTIEVNVPILGIVCLTDFIDEVLNQTSTRYFEKTFRYSVDGITYSDWKTLSNSNLQQIEIEPTNTFRVQYRYTRTGSDNTGTLNFNYVTLNGVFQEVTCGERFSKSIFARFFSCISIDVLGWMLNVLEKIYAPGIIPKYIQRNRNANDLWEDKDYIDFWRSITWFFAIIVVYGRLFENFDKNEILLDEYLKSRDILLNDERDLSDLNFILNNLYSQIRERGTSLIAVKKNEITDIDESDESSSSDIKQVNGELFNLISYKELDEFIFCLVEPWKIGWNIGNSSPLYKGTNQMMNCIKGYENSHNVIDITRYPLINEQYISIVSDLDDSSSSGSEYEEKSGVFLISNVPNGSVSGIGVSSSLSKPILIDSSLDYEITFLVKSMSNEPLTFGIKGFNRSGASLSFFSAVTGLTNYFFTQIQLPYLGKYYFIRGILYNFNHSSLTDLQGRMECDFGYNLRFQESHKYIVPYVVLDNNSGNVSQEMYIYDLKIRPLKFDYSLGFVGLKNLIVAWLKNNSSKYYNEQITYNMKEKLIPYNCALTNNFI